MLVEQIFLYWLRWLCNDWHQEIHGSICAATDSLLCYFDLFTVYYCDANLWMMMAFQPTGDRIGDSWNGPHSHAKS